MNGPRMVTTIVVRRRPDEVFEQLVDPRLTTRFWFTDSTGPLEAGTSVRWTWAMYDVHADVHVEAVEPGRRIAYAWGDDDGTTDVEWTFEPHADGTRVEVTESGFAGTPDEVGRTLVDTTVGHTKVLCALKALLEHGVDLNVVVDQ